MKELLGRGGPRREKQCEVSVIVCCARTDDSLKDALQKIRRIQETIRVKSEIIVVNDGVIPSAVGLAEKANAVVTIVDSKGYGAAIMAGVNVSRGKYILAGVADGRYDFMEIPKLYDQLRNGYSYVPGCRMPAGGGNIRPNAMSFARRWILNPMFSFLLKLVCGTRLNDPGSRLFGISREYYNRLGMSCVGSDFNTELTIKSCRAGGKVVEIPITLHQVTDGSSHSDMVSLRHSVGALAIYAASSSLWVLAMPGLLLLLTGLAGIAAVLYGYELNGARLNMHALILSCGLAICGWQLVMSILTFKLAAVKKGVVLVDTLLVSMSGRLARSLADLTGVIMLAAGIFFMSYGFTHNQAFAGPDYGSSMKCFVPGTMLLVMGIQVLLSSAIMRVLCIDSSRG